MTHEQIWHTKKEDNKKRKILMKKKENDIINLSYRTGKRTGRGGIQDSELEIDKKKSWGR